MSILPKRVLGALAAGCALIALVSGSRAADLTYEDLTDEELDTAIGFVLGNGIATLYHEAGHMFVSELEIPITAREEDAVDNLASIMLLEPEDETLDQAVRDTADSFFMSDDLVAEMTSEDAEEDESKYWDEHGMDRQRGYSVVCLAVGRDPEAFKDIADYYDLPQERRESCAYEYVQVLNSWNTLLEPHIRTDGRKSRIKVIYDENKNENLDFIAGMTKKSTLIEIVADHINEAYKLEDGITFRASECGTINAFWSPSDRTVTYCYELAQFYSDLILKYLSSVREESASDTAE